MNNSNGSNAFISIVAIIAMLSVVVMADQRVNNLEPSLTGKVTNVMQSSNQPSYCQVQDLQERARFANYLGDKLTLGESMGEVRSTLTGDDLMFLKSSDPDEQIQYEQIIRFNSDQPGLALSSPTPIFSGNDAANEEVRDWLFIDEGVNAPYNAFFEYELSFPEGLFSTIEQNYYGLELVDLLGERLNFMGLDMMIYKARIFNNQELKLELMPNGIGAIALEDGETEVHTFEGQSFEFTLWAINITNNSQTARFAVNNQLNQLTAWLEVGQQDSIQGGHHIRLLDIESSERGYRALFLFGGNPTKLEDSNIFDGDFQGSFVEINKEIIEEAMVSINALPFSNSSNITLTGVNYRLTADPRVDLGAVGVFVEPGHIVREYLDEPEGMINPDWGIGYDGLRDGVELPMILESYEDDQYKLTATNMQGDVYTFDLFGLSTPTSNSLKTGRASQSSRSLIWKEPFNFMNTNGTNGSTFYPSEANIYRRSSFIVNNGGENGISHILTYDSINPSSRILYFTDLASGTVTASYINVVGIPGVIGTGTLNLDGNEYLFYVTDGVDNPLAIDLNADGDIAGDVAYFQLFGGDYYLDLASSDLDFGRYRNTARLSFPMMLVSHHAEEELPVETISWTGSIANLTVQLSPPTTNLPGSGPFSFLNAPDSNDNNYFGATQRGVLVDYYNSNSGLPQELTLSVPTELKFNDAYVYYNYQLPPQPRSEVCGDGLDNDCDGRVDENCKKSKDPKLDIEDGRGPSGFR